MDVDKIVGQKEKIFCSNRSKERDRRSRDKGRDYDRDRNIEKER